MGSYRLALVVILLAPALLGPSFQQPTAASPPPPPGEEALFQMAEYVVEGRVERVTSVWDEDRATIFTWVTLSVNRRLKGDPGPVITLRHRGGQVGELGLLISTEPSFAVGERVRVYLRSGEDGIPVVVWGAAGKIHLGGTSVEPTFVYDGLHWYDEDLPVPYWVNNAGSEDIPDDSEFTAVQNAFETWTDVGCSYMVFAGQGLTPTTPSTDGTYDGYNVVGWMTQAEWGGDLPPEALAVNQFWYRNDRLLEFDITFFEDHLWGTQGQGDRFDVQSVALHEAGHALSLGHTYIPDAVMYPYIAKGQIKRTLHQDDINGICTIYPRPFTVSPTFLAFLQDAASGAVHPVSYNVEIGGSGQWKSTVDRYWIQRWPESGDAPAETEVWVSGTDGFAPGIYTGTVEISAGSGSVETVTVRLAVGDVRQVHLPLVLHDAP